MADLDPVSFLRATPPFDGLPPHEFERASAALEVVFHPAGDLVIARDGPPSEHLYIVRKGLVRFERDGETVLVLEPGDLFGFTSVMAGATPFNVVVERDLLAYRVPAGVVRSMLVVPAVARYFSESLAERLRWTAEPARVASGGDLHLPVERLVRRAPVVVAPDATVGDVARRMSDAQASSALVDAEPDGHRHGPRPQEPGARARARPRHASHRRGDAARAHDRRGHPGLRGVAPPGAARRAPPARGARPRDPGGALGHRPAASPDVRSHRALRSHRAPRGSRTRPAGTRPTSRGWSARWSRPVSTSRGSRDWCRG